MKPFKTFITEETASEPFHSIKEVPAKKDLVDVHIKLATAKPGCYGKSKIGSEIPDREMKHVQVKLGKQKFKGWGETHPSLEAADLPKSTLKAHKDHIDTINKKFVANGEVPMSVKQVHVLYAPRRTLIHMTNGTHEMAMTYSQGVSNGSGLRNYITTNGTKVPASQAQNKSMHTGEEDYEAVNREAKSLQLSNRYGAVDGYNSHAHANTLVRTGNAETHKIIWDKMKQAHEHGWEAGPGIALNIYHATDNEDIKKEIKTYFPGIGNYR